MDSLKLIRAGRQILHKTNPNIPPVVSGIGNYALNPVQQPQLAYMWEVEFFDPSGKGETLKYYAKNTSIPSFSADPIKKHYLGATYAYSGRDSSEKVFTVTFWDNQKLEVYSFFDQWIKLTNSTFDKFKTLPENHMREIHLKMMDTTDFFVNRRFVHHDCFPTEISEIQLSYENSDTMEFSVSFFYSEKEATDRGVS